VVLSPFVLVGTSGADGACDVSPRGDAPGFVLDEKTLAIPERLDNRRLDSLLNVLETGSVGLLFLVPGFEETLRVNGRASVVRDADVLERAKARGKASAVAIGVEVQECFLHCAKAFKRSSLWEAEGWPERSALPSLGWIFRDQGTVPGASAEDLEGRIELRQTPLLRAALGAAAEDPDRPLGPRRRELIKCLENNVEGLFDSPLDAEG
jgi:PPOX class probable FMN-dependent enzyme